ncbi:MAG: hypothetical protein ACRD3W_02540, partial [Terriglobales bacterium]
MTKHHIDVKAALPHLTHVAHHDGGVPAVNIDTAASAHVAEHAWSPRGFGGGGAPAAPADRTVAARTTDKTGVINNDQISFTPLPTGQASNRFLHFGSPNFNMTAADAAGIQSGQSGATVIADRTGTQVGRPQAGTAGSNALYDPKQKVGDLVQSGQFKDGTKDASDKDYVALKPGEVPKVSVTYENKDSNPQPPPPKPNYIVGKDGTV